MKKGKRPSAEEAKPVGVARTIAGIEPVGCDDDVLKGRELPPHPEGQRLLRVDLEAMREWLSPEWLCASGAHPVRDMWRRCDAGATSELQCLAASIARIVPKARAAEGGKRLLADWRKRITGADAANMRGSLFEVYAAGLFDGDDHPVRTVGEGEPGYDFAVGFENGSTLRVSCKARDESVEEKRAKTFAAALRDKIKSTVPTGVAVGVEVYAPPNAHASFFDVGRVFSRVRLAIGMARRQRDEVELDDEGGWRVRAFPEACPQPGFSFRERDRLSFTLFVSVPLDRERIAERFRQHVIDSLSNLQKHCDTGDDRANVIVYRIPTKLALVDARAAVRDAFESTTSTATSSVFMYRAQLNTIDPKRERYYLGHELDEVQNERAPRAGRIMPRGTIALKLNGGRVQKVEPGLTITKDDKHTPIDVDTWIRIHGEHHYVHPSMRANVSVRRLHGIALWLTHQAHGGIVERPMSAGEQDAIELL